MTARTELALRDVETSFAGIRPAIVGMVDAVLNIIKARDLASGARMAFAVGMTGEHLAGACERHAAALVSLRRALEDR